MVTLNPICNYQLRRTLPKLSGNMQLDLVLGAYKDPTQNVSMLRVDQAHLRPIATDNFVPVVDERIMDRPHQNNIKEFYTKTRSTFFNHPSNAYLNSDWPMMISEKELPKLKYIKNWDDSCWSGCKRMSHKLYGTTHEILVPVWLEKAYGIRFKLSFYTNRLAQAPVLTMGIDLSPLYLYGKTSGGAYTYNTSPEFDFHNDFVKYILEYFDYINLPSGNANVLNIDLKNNTSVISGLQVDSGNLLTRTDPNICRNLIYRERPLLEANSLLTNTFQDYRMIATQLINFNLCFDLEDIMRSRPSVGLASTAYDPGTSYMVEVTTQVLRHIGDLQNSLTTTEPRWDVNVNNDTGEYGWKWVDLEIRDFYTNHHYIPRNKLSGLEAGSNSTVYTDDTQPLNSLNYKHDYLCTDIIHKNKMTQPICHWVPSIQPDNDMLFNVYDGFAAYMEKDGNIVEYSHGFGATIDPNNPTYDEGADNTIWAGVPVKGIGSQIENLFATPDSDAFHDASGFINGLKYTYNPNNVPTSSEYTAPSAVYLATMTTGGEMGVTSTWGPESSPLRTTDFIGIVSDLFDAEGNSILPDSTSGWEKYSDVDNKWSVQRTASGTKQSLWYLKNKPTTYKWSVTKPTESGEWVRVGNGHATNFNARDTMNLSSLFVCMRNIPRNPKSPLPSDPLYVVFWSPQGKVGNSSDGFSKHNIIPHALTLGGCIQHLKGYIRKYSPAVLALKTALAEGTTGISNLDQLNTFLKKFNDLEVVNSIMSTILVPDIISFSRTIQQVSDVSCSHAAHEITYVKDDVCQTWVERYSGNIKPAMFPPKTDRVHQNTLKYKKLYGRNYMWVKNPVLPGTTLPGSLGRYISTNIPPRYTSLGYDPVVPCVIKESTKTATGQLGSYVDTNFVVPFGDLMYDEPSPLYFGRTNDGTCLDLLVSNSPIHPTIPIPEVQPYALFGSKWTTIPGLENVGSEADVFVLHKDEPDYESIYNAAAKEYIKSGHPGKIFSNNLPVYWAWADTFNTYNWPEYKWFNKSFIRVLPQRVDLNIEVSSEDPAVLEAMVMDHLIQKVFNDSTNHTNIDPAYIKMHYDIDYHLNKVTPKHKKSILERPLDPPIIRPKALAGNLAGDLAGDLSGDFGGTTIDPSIIPSIRPVKTPVQFERDPRTNQVLYTYNFDVTVTLK